MRRLAGAGCLVLLAGVTQARADDGIADVPSAPVVVRLSDYAGLPAGVLGKAVLLARAVLREAGVASDWAVSGGEDLSRARDSRPAADPAGRLELTLDLFGRRHTRALATSVDVLGVALLPGRGDSQPYAVVYVEKAEALGRTNGVPLAVVLGHAMAHEVGHLLLGTHDHSAIGLMRGQWSSEELQRAAQGQLRFSEDESARLRRAVGGRFVADGRAALLTRSSDITR
jgi:hypothetical protein